MLLDRDGTIIVDDGYVGSVDRVRFIDGSAQAIAALNRAGMPVAVISNQAGVARGFYSTDDVEAVHRHIAEHLAERGARIDLFLYCPYHPDGTVSGYDRPSFDRKPEPGMALTAARELELDLASSWIVGDRPDDMAVANAVGALGLFLGPDSVDHGGIWSFPDLATAAAFILHRTQAAASDQEPGTRSPRPSGRPKFPRVTFDDASSYWQAYLLESQKAARSVDARQVDRAAALLLASYTGGATVFTCGNGGSAALANHMQCDHVKGVRTSTELRPRVTSLSANVELMTAIANDLSYDDVFRYQLQSQAREGDVLLAISSSGQSPNVVRALRWAGDNGLATIALTGFSGGEAAQLADVSIHVESGNYGVVEDTHEAVMHVLAQHLRASGMAPDAVRSQYF